MIITDSLAIILYIPIVVLFNLKIGTLNLTRLMLVMILLCMVAEKMTCEYESLRSLKESIIFTCFAAQKALSLLVVFCIYPLGLKMLEIP